LAKSTYFCFIFSSPVGQKTMPLCAPPALLGGAVGAVGTV
jgi:hypothetical protein